MSEAVSALGGARFEGAALVADSGPRGMITVRGDLSDAKLVKAVTGAAGVAMPGQREACVEGEKGLLWMSPDELMVLVPYAEAPAAAEKIATALKGTHHLVANVSDARAVFAVTGAAAREVLAKLTPADLHVSAFGPGQVRRSRFAQVAAAFWMTDETGFELFCFRSQAVYMFDLLCEAARKGAGVGYF